MDFQKISILGLGLIGGSLAKAFKRLNMNITVFGMDCNDQTLAQALNEGIIDKAFSNPRDAVKDADLVFLSTPTAHIPALLSSISKSVPLNCIISDTGSTKRGILDAAQRVLPPGVFFIGGHPMAGTEQSGYCASIPHLFENAYYILTPLPSTTDDVTDKLKHFLSFIGALPLVMNASHHDKITGSISHLPHVVAAALVNTVKELEDPHHYKEKLAAGGFRDITRIASSNPEMWKDISLLNRTELLPLIEAMINQLLAFKGWLKQSEAELIHRFFTDACEFRSSLPTRQSLTLLPYHDLYVDIEDRPGIIGEVTTFLGKHQINIKNLRIINSREEEPGCLVLSLSDMADIHRASEILNQEGYNAYVR